MELLTNFGIMVGATFGLMGVSSIIAIFMCDFKNLEKNESGNITDRELARILVAVWHIEAIIAALIITILLR